MGTKNSRLEKVCPFQWGSSSCWEKFNRNKEAILQLGGGFKHALLLPRTLAKIIILTSILFQRGGKTFNHQLDRHLFWCTKNTLRHFGLNFGHVSHQSRGFQPAICQGSLAAGKWSSFWRPVFFWLSQGTNKTTNNFSNSIPIFLIWLANIHGYIVNLPTNPSPNVAFETRVLIWFDRPLWKVNPSNGRISCWDTRKPCH